MTSMLEVLKNIYFRPATFFGSCLFFSTWRLYSLLYVLLCVSESSRDRFNPTLVEPSTTKVTRQWYLLHFFLHQLCCCLCLWWGQYARFWQFFRSKNLVINYSSFFSVIISSIFVLRSIFCGQEKEWCVKGVKEGPEAVARIRKILEAVATTLIGKDCTGGGAGGWWLGSGRYWRPWQLL